MRSFPFSIGASLKYFIEHEPFILLRRFDLEARNFRFLVVGGDSGNSLTIDVVARRPQALGCSNRTLPWAQHSLSSGQTSLRSRGAVVLHEGAALGYQRNYVLRRRNRCSRSLVTWSIFACETKQ